MTRLFVPRSSAPRHLVTSLSPRSGASSPCTVVAAGPGRGVVERDKEVDVEDLILDNESRRSLMQSNTRGITQIAASRRAAARHGRTSTLVSYLLHIMSDELSQ